MPLTNRKLSYVDYRVALAQELIDDYCSRKRLGRPQCPGYHEDIRDPFPGKNREGKVCTVQNKAHCMAL